MKTNQPSKMPNHDGRPMRNSTYQKSAAIGGTGRNNGSTDRNNSRITPSGNQTRKNRNRRSGGTGRFVVLATGIIVVGLVCVFLYQAFNTKPSSSVSGSENSGSTATIGGSSLDHSSDTGSNAEFWGDSIDLSAEIQPVAGEKALTKWPAEPGFDIVETDLSAYLSKAKNSTALEGITVILDPGHGGEDLGAVYPRAPIKPEIIESRVNLSVASLVKEKLESLGATVVLTRTDNTYYKLYYRSAVAAKTVLTDFYAKLGASSPNRSVINEYIRQMDLAIEANSDDDKSGWFYGLGVRREIKNILDIEAASSDFLYLSIHCNSSEIVDSLHGVNVYYATNSAVYKDETTISKDVVFSEYQFYNDAKRERFADLVYDNMIRSNPEMTPKDTQNAVKQRNYSVIREQNLVSALIELGYVNHSADRAFLLDPVKQDAISESITNAIYEYYCKNE